MRYVTASMRAMALSLRNMFRKPTTVEYPEEKRERAPRMRASFALVHNADGEEACIGCLMCERICPSSIITIVQGEKRESAVTGKKRGWADDFTLDLQACIICELCVQVCPEDAIIMTREQERPGYRREDLVLTMDKLYANEKKALAWGRGSILMDMQDPKRPVEVPAETAEAKPAAEKPAAETAAAKPAAEKAEAEKPAAKPAAEKAEAEKPASKTSLEKPAAEEPAEKTSLEKAAAAKPAAEEEKP
ncbi:MAG: NADH-quinone oxidoreductase subunit I [Myxococcales bacterium]|nr:NADH-quinone oxidoreductase subunit I [Myxococcales bacterium]MCB9538512.1 NADH-quinone oxidoreductase subunit I [Myxococcales bacterium]